MKKILHDFWNFIKDPRDERYLENDRNYKWKVLLTLFILNILISIIYGGIIMIIDLIYPLDHKFGDIDLPFIPMLFVVAVFVPFIEEVIFRLGLRRKGILANFFTETTWHKYFPAIIYSSTITFALVHITNYIYDSYFFFIINSHTNAISVCFRFYNDLPTCEI